jgi:aspartate aminotransferase
MVNQYLNLPIAPADAAFGLMADFDADPHPNKVSLIAGAYRDANGKPWILPSVLKVLYFETQRYSAIKTQRKC